LIVTKIFMLCESSSIIIYLFLIYLARICSKHFHPSQFEDKSWLQDFVGKSGNVRIKLKRDAVPLIAVEDNKISMDNDLGIVHYIHIVHF